jgi:hypothetical protein
MFDVVMLRITILPHGAVIDPGQPYLTHNMGGGVARGRGMKSRRRAYAALSETRRHSFPRKRESRIFLDWVPADAGTSGIPKLQPRT